MQNKVKEKSTLIKDALALFLITFVSGLALSFVFEITKAPIKAQGEEKKLKANQEVFEAASTFEADEALTTLALETDLATLNADYKGIIIDEINQAKDSSGNVLGYNIMVTTSQSYKDSITLVIGYSKDGIVQGVSITTISETAGLGMKAVEPEFIGQYVNKNVKEFVVTKTGATSEDQIDAISGATITSKAVTNAINAGISFINNYADLGGGQ